MGKVTSSPLNMKNFASFGRKLKQALLLSNCSSYKLASIYESFKGFTSQFFNVLLFQVNPFWIQLVYFVTLSFLGHWALRFTKPRTPSLMPNDMDLFFTSVSAATVSSMSAVEMEVFSNTQLVIMTILMFAGGEVFTSMLGLQFSKSKFPKQHTPIINHNTHPISSDFVDQIELGLVTRSGLENKKPNTDLQTDVSSTSNGSNSLKYKSIKFLRCVVLGYLLLFHVVGCSLISLYIGLVPSARATLKSKNLSIQTFSIFTTVSTFANCGFVPTNENMIVFKKNSGLLFLLIPQILLGNTLYPPCLRLFIWLLKKITRREEASYILENHRDMGYNHLLSGFHCCLLAITIMGFSLLQLVLFCCLEWNSEALSGLNSYDKFVASLFQVMNSRHAGESVFDLSVISPAILVLFILMMYFPPYTSILPVKDHEILERTNEEEGTSKRKNIVENLIFSQLSYLVIFIIIIAITERKSLKEDPLNFNVLNITLEVISAYGNVGLSTGYSCKRQLKPNSTCRDKWTGFSGRWSNNGKFFLILVMFFGRLKNFNVNGGKAWKLS